MAGYTKQERSLIVLSRIWAASFLGAAILFAIAPDYTLNYITDIGRGIFGWYSPGTTLGGERFWLVPAVSLHVGLSYLCIIVQREPARYIEFMNLFLLVTFVSAAGFLICLFTQQRQFFYLAGAVVEFTIFTITLVIYKSAMRSRNRWS